MRTFALALLALCLLLLAASLAPAATCFADAEGVRHVNPGSWPSWTKRMEGHKGERCWIPSFNKHSGERKVMQAVPVQPQTRRNNNRIDTRPRSALSPTGAIPLPRPRLAHASILESAPVPLSEIEHLQKALVRAGQPSNFEERFSATGWK